MRLETRGQVVLDAVDCFASSDDDLVSFTDLLTLSLEIVRQA